MKESGASPEVIARRLLTDKEGDSVEIVIFKPEEEETTEHSEWACRIEVRRGARTETHCGRGVDSLQALSSAHGLLYRTFKTSMSELRWLGEPGAVGLPLVVSHCDPVFLDLIDYLVMAECCRQILLRTSLERVPTPTEG